MKRSMSLELAVFLNPGSVRASPHYGEGVGLLKVRFTGVLHRRVHVAQGLFSLWEQGQESR